MHGYGSHLCFDELNATGHKVRMKNKMKARNLMMLAVNFVDPGTLGRIKGFLAQLGEEDRAKFDAFIKQRIYLSKNKADYVLEQHILDKVTHLALSSIPKDPELHRIMTLYNGNLEQIDQLKIATTKTADANRLNLLIAQINELNSHNVTLLDRVGAYREKHYGKKDPLVETV